MTRVIVEDSELVRAASTVPAGAWGIALSGGADSVALVRLLHAARPDVSLHVVHLDHETRNGESAADASFVKALAASQSLPVSVTLRSEIEAILNEPVANTSVWFRACRLKLFRQVVALHKLAGVLLAHHADDQAESVLLRLLRGNSFHGLVPMSPETVVDGVRLVRPLLDVRRAKLRDFLANLQQPWRDDASNTSDDYARNRVRKLLAMNPNWVTQLLELAARCRALKEFSSSHAPVLGDEIDARLLAELPRLLADESARRWLVAAGVPEDEVDRPIVARLVTMVTDAASPTACEFPGRVRVRRRGGKIFVSR